MIERKLVEVYACTCERCRHAWLSLGTEPPEACPSCHSRAWNGAKPLGRPKGTRKAIASKLPRPRRVRDLEEL